MHSHAMPAGSGGWMVCQCRHSKQEQVNAWLYQYCMHLIVIECQDIILYLACSSQLFYELGMRLTNTGWHSTVHPTALSDSPWESYLSLSMCIHMYSPWEFYLFLLPQLLNHSTDKGNTHAEMAYMYSCTMAAIQIKGTARWINLLYIHE